LDGHGPAETHGPTADIPHPPQSSFAALVYDTLYREIEFVAADTPVVSLLPPGNIKVRFFVSEAEFAGLKADVPFRVILTGRHAPLAARISYLSPLPESTTPDPLQPRETRQTRLHDRGRLLRHGSRPRSPPRPAGRRFF